MRAMSDSPPATDGRTGIPGWRVVLAFLAIAGGIALAVIIVGTIAIRGSDTGSTPKTAPEAAARAAVLDYSEALNARDAVRLVALMTGNGLFQRWNARTTAELEARLASLTADDRTEEMRVTSIRVNGDRALVTTRFQWRGQDQEAVFRLLLVDGRWLVDG
jgi:hypothetical protein